MKLNEVLTKSIQFFKDKKIETARLDAEILVSHALKIPRIQLYVKYDQPLDENEITACREFVRRRSLGEPVAYITEEKGFYGLNFKVRSGVLIPRPETELIIDEVLADHKKKSTTDTVRMLDLGSGTGCIGLSILKNIPNSELVTIERSQTAFEVLTENIKSLELNDRVKAIHSDVLKMDVTPFSQFDYVVSNPPYIDQHDKETEQFVKKFEPHEALFSPDQGLSDIKSWATHYSHLVKPSGLMLFEIGYQQGSAVKVYFESLQKFKSVDVIKDLSGLDRIIKARA